MSPILTVVGATGAQGKSVVAHALKDGIYKVRAITRNATGEEALHLRTQGVEVVSADVNHEDSLIKAFKGSTAIYALTNFFEPFLKSGPDHAVKVELQQGIKLANAALATPTLKHYIWSTLPNSAKISGGKWNIPHFEGKNGIDEYIKSKADLLSKTTFLWIGYYGTNILGPHNMPNFLKSASKYVQINATSPDAPVKIMGDVSGDVGLFTSAILAKPELTRGRFVFAYTEEGTTGGMLEVWSKVTGKQAVYLTVHLNDLDRAFPGFGMEVGIMMQFWEDMGEKGWSGEEFLTAKELGIDETKFKSMEDTLTEIDWDGLL